MGSCKTAATIAGALVVSLSGATVAWSEDKKEAAATTTTRPAPVPTVTQEMLSGAATDTKNNLHTNLNYDQTRYYKGKQIN